MGDRQLGSSKEEVTTETEPIGNIELLFNEYYWWVSSLFPVVCPSLRGGGVNNKYMKDEKIYMLTDGCLWEINKQSGNEHPHSVEVVDIETGAIRYIKSGSRITFVEGEISDIRTQEAYNKIQKTEQEMPDNKQDLPKRTERKSTSLRREPKRNFKSL